MTSRVLSARLNPYASSPLNIATDSSSCIGMSMMKSAPTAARRAMSAVTSTMLSVRLSDAGSPRPARLSTIAASAAHQAVSGDTVYNAPPAIPRSTAATTVFMRVSVCHYNRGMAASHAAWPVLSSPEWPAFNNPKWPDTYATLHMWTQIVGKIRLKLAPRVNHWWGTAFQLCARGITTMPMPYNGASFEMIFDFCSHELHICANDNRVRSIKLEPKSVADFYAEVMSVLADMGIAVKIWTMP